MFYKCHYCDPVFTKEMKQQGKKPIKTIDTDKMDFIKDESGKYYHQECFRQHLKNDKKMTDDEITIKFNKLYENTMLESQEADKKDKFLRWIMEFYDGSLPSYYIKKLQTVREGTYEGLLEPITYDTLLDIYSHMENYLKKIALKKNFKSVTSRMNYDLAVVIGNYGDYKRFKEKQRLNESDNNEVNKQTNVTDKVEKIIKTENQNEEFDITDVMDDLLL